MSQISEYSEAGITVRGQYYGPGKTPPEGERKLFLAIESTSELAVQKAGFSTIISTINHSPILGQFFILLYCFLYKHASRF